MRIFRFPWRPTREQVLVLHLMVLDAFSFISINDAPYDPIYLDAITPHNIHLHTVFTSSNGKLTLISVPPVWSIMLKFVRYLGQDPSDICLLLRSVIVHYLIFCVSLSSQG